MGMSIVGGSGRGIPGMSIVGGSGRGTAAGGSCTVTGGTRGSAGNAGISSQEAEAFRVFTKAVATFPLEGQELRTILLRAWRRDYGALRFCYPQWRDVPEVTE